MPVPRTARKCRAKTLMETDFYVLPVVDRRLVYSPLHNLAAVVSPRWTETFGSDAEAGNSVGRAQGDGLSLRECLQLPPAGVAPLGGPWRPMFLGSAVALSVHSARGQAPSRTHLRERDGYFLGARPFMASSARRTMPLSSVDSMIRLSVAATASRSFLPRSRRMMSSAAFLASLTTAASSK